MAILILGLVLFLGIHAVRIVANSWRTATMARIGEPAWKGLYALLSLLGFVLIVWGFGLARQQPVQLWMPPRGMRHLAALLTLSLLCCWPPPMCRAMPSRRGCTTRWCWG